MLSRQWIRNGMLPVYIGGAELNVATALAQWSMPVKYGSVLPDHYLSREIIGELKSKKINTSAIHISGNRIGIYYLPQGADLKSVGVIYDRVGSSFAELKPGTIDWNEALRDCSWFHFSAISPALNENAALVCKEAVKAASSKGIMISVDLNYRAKLWKYGKQPVDVMPELVQYCDVIMGNLWAVESLLGLESPINNSEGKDNDELLNAAGISMMKLHKGYPKAKSFAYTFRLQNEYWAVLQYGPEKAVSKPFLIGQVADKAGSGDCFMAGLIYGIYYKHKPKDIINFAAAAAVGKLHEPGDATRQTVEQIKAKM